MTTNTAQEARITAPATATAHVSADALSLIRALTTPGEFIPVVWETSVRPAAAFKAHALRKITRAAVEVGTAYKDLADVKADIAAEHRGPVGALPWGEWAAFPYIVTHKGNEYVRLNLSSKGVMSVTCFVDDVEVDRATFDTYVIPSQRAGAKPMPATITVPVENLRSLGAVVLSA
jgi:hypothetical protein